MPTTVTRADLRRSWNSWLSNDLRRVGPWWLTWVWTLLFCSALAAVFTVLGFITFARSDSTWGTPAGWLYWYGKNWVVCTTIGTVIHLMFEGLAKWLSPERIHAWRPWQRTLFFSGVPLIGLAIGWPLGMQLAGADTGSWLLTPAGKRMLGTTVVWGLLITFVLHHVFSAKTKQIEAERRATEAQLRLLQAQMEPHFLFNTLANVQGLIDQQPAKAKQMLESFTDYLRATLTQLRSDDSTVGAELDLAAAYLQLLATRMEDRLRFEIHADDAARRQKLPPLLLQPLVENAIHHGLEPKLEGGMVSLHARVLGGQLQLEVLDDGMGLATAPRRGRKGAGVALANLRERLLSRYGARARFEIHDAAPGTIARITLPAIQP